MANTTDDEPTSLGPIPTTDVTNPPSAESDPAPPRIGDVITYYPDPMRNDDATAPRNATVVDVHDDHRITLEYIDDEGLRVIHTLVGKATLNASAVLRGVWHDRIDQLPDIKDAFSMDAPTIIGRG